MEFLNLVVVPVIINGGISEEAKELLLIFFFYIPFLAFGCLGLYKMGYYLGKLIHYLFLKIKNIIKNKK